MLEMVLMRDRRLQAPAELVLVKEQTMERSLEMTVVQLLRGGAGIDHGVLSYLRIYKTF